MNGNVRERLYDLLPAIYRIRDAEGDRYDLRALMALIEKEVDAIEGDIEGLYENWFIETCQPWVVPYIGDLLGVRGLHRATEAAKTFNQRAYVANTLAFRRREGPAAMLEQLARDVTGFPARVVEFFGLLATTQHLNHLRPDNLATPDLRQTDQLDLLDTPFDPHSRSAEVRRIARERGRYNISNVGIFLWRLQAYPIEGAQARQVRPGRYTFNPFGFDAALFNVPDIEEEITHIAEALNVPGGLRRRALYDELEAFRQGGDEAVLQWFDPARPAFEILVRPTPGAAYEQVVPENLFICDLSAWRRPDPPDGEGAVRVMVDPQLGRMTFPDSDEPDLVRINYACGFSGDLGGGPYNREEAVLEVLSDALDLDGGDDFSQYVDWQVGVSRDEAGQAGVFGSLIEAVRAWNAQPPGTFGVIVVMDNATYVEKVDGDDRLRIPEGSTLLILAAGWPLVAQAGAPPGRTAGQWEATERRPHLLGDLSVRGTAPEDNPGTLLLNGLAIEGELRVLVGNLGRLHLSHCTLIADRTSEEMRPSVLEVNPSVVTGHQNTRLKVEVAHCVCGPVGLPDTVPSLHVKQSIIDQALGEASDGDTEVAILAPGTAVEVEGSTVFGRTTCYRLDADDTIFTHLLEVERRQVGCVRFCFVPPLSRTPRRYRCQPDAEGRARLEQAQKEAHEQNQTLSQADRDAIQAGVAAWLKPRFTSSTFGDPGYAQLRRTTALEIRTGAEGSGEMGAFNSLQFPEREENLRASLAEYLRFGLEAGLFFVT